MQQLQCIPVYKDINSINLFIISYKHKFNGWKFISSFSVLFFNKTLGTSKTETLLICSHDFKVSKGMGVRRRVPKIFGELAGWEHGWPLQTRLTPPLTWVIMSNLIAVGWMVLPYVRISAPKLGTSRSPFTFHSRSSKVTRIDRVTMTFYYWSLVTVTELISFRFLDRRSNNANFSNPGAFKGEGITVGWRVKGLPSDFFEYFGLKKRMMTVSDSAKNLTIVSTQYQHWTDRRWRWQQQQQ